ncbi:hypothetical protein D3C71_1181420 [compost metagenome]
MVVQAGVQHRVGHVAALLEHVVALHRVAAHHGEFLVGELAGLVEHGQRDGRLAQIVQQACHARQPLLVVLELELLGQGHHQRAHRHRVHVGVVVGRFQARQADERAGVAGDGIRNFFHQALCTRRVHRAAHAGLVEHRDHGFFGFHADGSGHLEFAVHVRRIAVALGRWRWGWQRDFDGRQVLKAAEVGVNLRVGLLARHRRGARRHVQPLVGVNPDFLDGSGLYPGQVPGVFEQELGPPERVVHPRPAELVQIHAQGEMLNVNALEHGRGPGL